MTICQKLQLQSRLELNQPPALYVRVLQLACQFKQHLSYDAYYLAPAAGFGSVSQRRRQLHHGG